METTEIEQHGESLGMRLALENGDPAHLQGNMLYS